MNVSSQAIFLEDKVAQASKSGRVLRILDVGIGSGSQWLKFLQKHGSSVEFHATRITRTFDSSLKPRVKLCSAAILHKKFAPNYFDVVVTHCGMHFQEMIGLENIVHLLRPGGEAVVSTGLCRFEPAISKPFEEIDSVKDDVFFSFHIRKTG